MSVHETAALRYWRELNSTLSVIGADPVMLDMADCCRYEKLSIDEAAAQIAETQRENERIDRAFSCSTDIGWGPYGNAPSMGESWGRR